MTSQVKIQYQFRLSESEYQMLARLVRHGYFLMDMENEALTATVADFIQYLPDDADEWGDVPEDEESAEPSPAVQSESEGEAPPAEAKPRLGLFRRHSA